MYRRILLALHVAVLILISQEHGLRQSDCSFNTAAVLPVTPQAEPEAKEKRRLTRVESYVENFRIGLPGRNKIEIRRMEKDKTVISIYFYSLAKGGDWRLNQTIELERVNYPQDLEPEFRDFNNDGLKDFTFVSGEAARGANEVRTLLVYDKKHDRLVHIKNSEDYPNLEYNKKLNCVDSWMFHGATTTVFLKLEGDKLREFATVDTGLEREVALIDRSGNRRVVRREKMNVADIYTRYSNYNPPE